MLTPLAAVQRSSSVCTTAASRGLGAGGCGLLLFVVLGMHPVCVWWGLMERVCGVRGS